MATETKRSRRPSPATGQFDAISPVERSADWATLLSASVHAETDQVPPGWETAAQIRAKLGRSLAYVAKSLKQGVEQGVIERRTFRIPTRGRRTYPVPHYRPVN